MTGKTVKIAPWKFHTDRELIERNESFKYQDIRELTNQEFSKELRKAFLSKTKDITLYVKREYEQGESITKLITDQRS